MTPSKLVGPVSYFTEYRNAMRAVESEHDYPQGKCPECGINAEVAYCDTCDTCLDRMETLSEHE